MNYDNYLNTLKDNLTKLNKASKVLPGLPEKTDLGNQLLIQISGQLLELMRYMTQTKNPLHPITKTKAVTTAGTAEQLPDIIVPHEIEVIIQALVTNTDSIYVATSKLDAEDSTMRINLEPGDAISLQIDNLSEIWVNSAVDGEGVMWTVEQPKGGQSG